MLFPELQHRTLCASSVAIAIWLASLGGLFGQPITPRYDHAQLAPLTPPLRAIADSAAADTTAATGAEHSPHYDANVAPASFDRRLDLVPQWPPSVMSGANQQATLPEHDSATQPGQILCDGNACRIEPPSHHAELSSRNNAHPLLIDGQPHQAQPPTWTEQIALHAMDIDWKKMLGSLALVIGGYLSLVWIGKRLQTNGTRGLPAEVIEVIGVARLDARHQLQLIRLGSKLLLVSSGPEGATNIGEITSPQEVDHLVSLCTRRGRGRTAPTKNTPANASRAADPNLALEQLVHSLQQAVRRTGSHAEFEA